MVITSLLLAILTIAILLLLAVEILRRRSGIPGGEVVYDDAGNIQGEVMISKSVPLRGKPDFLIKEKKGYVPVEVKTGRTPREPYPNQIAQLYAYCLLVEENFGVKPLYGVISYLDKKFKQEYEKEDGEKIKELVEVMMNKKRKSFDRNTLTSVCKKCKAHAGEA